MSGTTPSDSVSDTPQRSMDVGYILPSLNAPGWRGWLRDTLNTALGVDQAYAIFEKAAEHQRHHGHEGENNTFLRALVGNRMTLHDIGLSEQLPASGAAIVIANHPFGGADAIALSGCCIQKRPDTKVLANAVTAELPGTRRWTIPLQILGESGATHSNRSAMKQALAHLRAGGVLVVFPAGAVSRWRSDLARVADPEWSFHVARLSAKTGAPVIPVRFFGSNPNWFEVLGSCHPIIRSALIIRVFLASRGRKIRFRAGKPVLAQHLASLPDVETMTQCLRTAVEEITEL